MQQSHLCKRISIFSSALMFILAHAGVSRTQVVYAAEKNVVCATSSAITGVDVSEYQPSAEWEIAQRSGRKFAFVKASEGRSLVDRKFRSDWNAAKEAGLLRGAYHYFIAADDAAEQASIYIDTVGRLGTEDLPPVLDWETSGNVSNARTIARAREWLERVKTATSKTPIIYTSPAYWHKLGNPAGFEQYPLFIAEYDVKCPEVPSPWKSWTFWQHAIGQTPGVSGSSDLDLFNGFDQLISQFAAAANL